MVRAEFALGTFAASDRQPFPGLVMGSRVHVLTRYLGENTSIPSLLEDWEGSFAALGEIAGRVAGDAAEYDLADLRPLPPILPGGQIFQAGANYRQHLVELSARDGNSSGGGHDPESREQVLAQIDDRARNGSPYIFLGLPHALAGAADDVVIPVGAEKVDWELELAAVIGRRAWRVSRDEAPAYIAGYTICNDITARDRVMRADLPVIGTDWLASKNSPTFFPTGPLLVPAAFAGDPMNLAIRLWVNGELMQDSTTADMMFDLGRLIEHASNLVELRPGDMLLTGSPAGNGVFHGRFLRPDDLIEAEITGLGRQRNRCVAEGAAETTPTLAPEGRA